MNNLILGTGLTGLVGSRIVELLQSEYEFEDLPFEQGFDITQKETIEEKIAFSGSDILIHLAAYTDVNTAWKEKEDKNGLCYRINVLGAKNIAELCRKYNKFLIHFSTDFVFNGEKEGAYTEEDSLCPVEWYGETKALAEKEVQISGCKYSIIRIAFPFRAQFPNKPDLIRKIILGIKKETLYPQFSDQTITPTFIDDIATGVGKIIEKQTEGIFHLVGSTSLSPYVLAQKVAENFGLDKTLVKEGSLAEFLKNNPASRPYQQNLRLSNQKVAKVLGVKMKTVDEALTEMKSQTS